MRCGKRYGRDCRQVYIYIGTGMPYTGLVGQHSAYAELNRIVLATSVLGGGIRIIAAYVQRINQVTLVGLCKRLGIDLPANTCLDEKSHPERWSYLP